jgi:hypothetical protein
MNCWMGCEKSETYLQELHSSMCLLSRSTESPKLRLFKLCDLHTLLPPQEGKTAGWCLKTLGPPSGNWNLMKVWYKALLKTPTPSLHRKVKWLTGLKALTAVGRALQFLSSPTVSEEFSTLFPTHTLSKMYLGNTPSLGYLLPLRTYCA